MRSEGINEHAPASSTREIQIEAPCETVWALIVDVEHWPRWNRPVSRVPLDGPFAPGSVLRWKSGASSLVSTIQEVVPPERVVWTGKSLGIDGVHVWELNAVRAGTIVRTSESFEGWLVWLFRGFFTRLLDRALDDVLLMLKAAAEDSTRAHVRSASRQ